MHNIHRLNHKLQLLLIRRPLRNTLHVFNQLLLALDVLATDIHRDKYLAGRRVHNRPAAQGPDIRHRQIRRSAGGYPAFVVVVEFNTPMAWMVRDEQP